MTTAAVGTDVRFRSARTDALTVGAAVAVLLMIMVAVLAPVLTPYPADAATAVHPTQALLSPSAAHPMGTDQVGRDVLTRVAYGARSSLLTVAAVLAVSAVVGVGLGLTAGYAGGGVRAVLLRLTDIVLAFPALLLAVALAVALGPGLITAIVAIAAGWWPWYVRLTAGLAASIRTRGYVDAARCLGRSPGWIALRHVLPNATTPVTVQLSLDAGGVILTASALSYLGLGVQEPHSDWGLMIAQGQALLTTNGWVVIFPGLALMITTLALNLLGEGLRSRLDPGTVR